MKRRYPTLSPKEGDENGAPTLFISNPQKSRPVGLRPWAFEECPIGRVCCSLKRSTVTLPSQMQTSSTQFEALLYSADPARAEQYSGSFGDFPANWMAFHEPEVASDFLEKEHFDFVVLDMECEHGRLMLRRLCESGGARQSVIFAVTGGAVDPEMLARCYEFGVFYPVRASEIRANLDRSLPAAERRAQQRAVLVSETEAIQSVDEEVKAAMPEVVQEVIHTSKALAWVLGAAATSVLCMRHSLGIAAQEWAASLLSAVASMWFVQEATADFRGLLNVGPPSAGPGYLLALALLLWLCAKQRRVSNKGARATVLGD